MTDAWKNTDAWKHPRGTRIRLSVLRKEAKRALSALVDESIANVEKLQATSFRLARLKVAETVASTAELMKQLEIEKSKRESAEAKLRVFSNRDAARRDRALAAEHALRQVLDQVGLSFPLTNVCRLCKQDLGAGAKHRRSCAIAVMRKLKDVEPDETAPYPGGAHLGVIRSWIQQKARNGSVVMWSSDDFLELPTQTVSDLEELAQRIADAAKREMERTRK